MRKHTYLPERPEGEIRTLHYPTGSVQDHCGLHTGQPYRRAIQEEPSRGLQVSAKIHILHKDKIQDLVEIGLPMWSHPPL